MKPKRAASDTLQRESKDSPLPGPSLGAAIGGAASITSGAREEETPKKFEVAALATLLAIHDAIRHPDEPKPKQPEAFFSSACSLLDRAGRFPPYYAIAQFLKGPPAPSEAFDDYEGERYGWKEVLAVQTEPPRGRSSLEAFVVGAPADDRLRTIRRNQQNGLVLFCREDLVNRPVGLSMIGSLGTEKALRNAIKRVFPGDAEAVISRKTLSVWEINRLLQEQVGIHRGRIPRVRAGKTSRG